MEIGLFSYSQGIPVSYSVSTFVVNNRTIKLIHGTVDTTKVSIINTTEVSIQLRSNPTRSIEGKQCYLAFKTDKINLSFQ